METSLFESWLVTNFTTLVGHFELCQCMSQQKTGNEVFSKHVRHEKIHHNILDAKHVCNEENPGWFGYTCY